MAEVTLPDTLPDSIEVGFVRDDNVLPLLSGRDVITSFPRAAWTVSFRFGLLEADEYRVWSAALIRLTRLENHFKMGPPGYTGPAYTGPAPTVAGAGQLGDSLNCTGATLSATVLRAGEYFEVGGELKIVIEDAISDASGNVTIEFEPSLRFAPSNGAALNIATPKAAFRFVTPQFKASVAPPLLFGTTVDAVEVVYA